MVRDADVSDRKSEMMELENATPGGGGLDESNVCF